MKEICYVIWEEEKYFVAQCLNVDVSSFGENKKEAIHNLKEAVELYFENEGINFPEVKNVFVGHDVINV